MGKKDNDREINEWYNEVKLGRQIRIAKEGFQLKKIALGIAILLFAIVVALCSSGPELFAIGIGVVGLIFSFIGFMEHK